MNRLSGRSPNAIKNSAELIKLLKKNGWQLKSIKGSHHKFKHPDFLNPIIIPHPKKDLQIGLISKILKQAGLANS